MAAAAVMLYVRGIDLTQNDFQHDGLPSTIQEMSRLRWLEANKTGLCLIPPELGALQNLEKLSLKSNKLESFDKQPNALPCLRTLNLRKNRITSDGLSETIFSSLSELTTLDLSQNCLESVPTGLENAKSLLVLNLSDNQIAEIPPQVFVQCTDLLYLNVANNKLETFPPQVRRLAQLKTLILNHNPLTHFQFRQLPYLISLETLHLRATTRCAANLPTNIDKLQNLSDIDLSLNGLEEIPECFYGLKSLKRVNLSDNCIEKIESDIERWPNLQVLNVCRNRLRALPNQLTKCENLTTLLVNENNIDFEGLPSGLGKLSRLEVFSASFNRLEMIPEGLCRCPNLKRLILPHNRLVTLPEAVHFLTDSLQTLNLDDNPQLIWPPKPRGLAKGAGPQFYNIDFSLKAQLSRAGNTVIDEDSQASPNSKDPIARKKRLRQFRKQTDSSLGESEGCRSILKGFTEIVKDEEKQRQKDRMTEERTNAAQHLHSQKRWDEGLERPPLNYEEFFERDVGQIPDLLSVWEIENFLPHAVDEKCFGHFYEGDCYIVLDTKADQANFGSLNWEIYFWIGNKASLDKKACSAIHAVNLRNYLGAQSRTHREEQGDESEEFLSLFGGDINIVEGERTASGFFTAEEIEYPLCMYRIHPWGKGVHLEAVDPVVSSLDPNHVFLLDEGHYLMVWQGKGAKKTLATKSRLVAEKISKDERKNGANIVVLVQGTDESNEEWDRFWDELGHDDPERDPNDDVLSHLPQEFNSVIPRLYQVNLGQGYLELPQVELPGGKLTPDLLKPAHVYMLDCVSEIFVWIGRKSTRMVYQAAQRLSQEMLRMLPRPSHAATTLVKEAKEPFVFKQKFHGWTDVLQVDYTRTADSVRRTGADLQAWAKKQETKVDLNALFTPRKAPLTLDESREVMDDYNDDLLSMECLVIEGKNLVKLPEKERNHFYSGESYVFVCKYCLPLGEGSEEDSQENDESQDECIVYFWQGRDASNMGWFTFKFTYQKYFVQRLCQQQEGEKFMSHFKRKMVIHKGRRPTQASPKKVPKNIRKKKDEDLLVESTDMVKESKPELFQMRTNDSPIFTRTIQIPVDASLLNSCYCYILKVPFENQDQSQAPNVDSGGIVYVWIGSKSDPDEARLIEEIAQTMYDPERYSLMVISEGEEPENFFWVGISGRKPYEKEATYLSHSRLFRCSNEKGYFFVSEKLADFCQDDLANDDTMLLDDGDSLVFLWLGANASEVEVKLAMKSAQVYIQNLRAQEDTKEKPRKLLCTFKGKESKKFKRCFHGWGEYRATAGGD